MNDDNQAELADGEEANDQTVSEPWPRAVDPAASSHPLGDKRPLDHGVKIRGKVKRGTDTRDQDELLIEGRGETAKAAAIDFEQALTEAEAAGWADRLRALQPGEGEDDE
jgi:hypothetical protein